MKGNRGGEEENGGNDRIKGEEKEEKRGEEKRKRGRGEKRERGGEK